MIHYKNIRWIYSEALKKIMQEVKKQGNYIINENQIRRFLIESERDWNNLQNNIDGWVKDGEGI
jgi:hypothetical protein